MSSRTLLYLLTAALLLALAAAAYAFAGRPATDGRTESAAARLDSLTNQLAHYEALAAGDSLLFAGRYAAARSAYAAGGLAGDPALADRLALRGEHLLRIGRLERALDTLSGRPARVDTLLLEVPVAPAAAPAPILPAATERLLVDSLRAALDRERSRARGLENRLNAVAAPEFFTFRTGAGNLVHYLGQQRDGQAHGQGAALLSTGSRYRGEWRANRKHGRGTFHWADGAYYEGEYTDDQRSGEGTYYFPDGSRYVGEWRNDLRHGTGTYYNHKGKVVAEGQWREDGFVEK